ncbi:MAG: hypothetical protein REI64_04485 [Pedobacter sp.]|uniref:hypothetical protein n=1 Tax=Pedobacter sp. TaxID=1411316 RepID=UPI0028077177|nr:hypothetical protein [Pedobacter sp.]MDQ8004036.1 hypothetical protein [Pedobacter sp.]
MKKSEEDLVQQIKSVFDDYNDGLSDQGWNELRKKFPEKESKKLPIWWLSGIAATLLVVAGLYFYNGSGNEKVILRANNTQKDSSSQKGKADDFKVETDIANAAKPTNTIENNEKVAPTESKDFRNAVQDVNNGLKVLTTEKLIAIQPKPVIASKDKTETLGNGITQGQLKTSTIIDENTIIASAQTNTDQGVKKPIDNNATALEKDAKSNTETKNTKLTTEEFLTEQSKILAANDNTKDIQKNSSSKTTFDVFTGTFFNYHDNNEAKLSAGVGLNANVKVTKNVVLSFGAGISQNKVSYENSVPTEISQAMFASKDNALNSAPVSGMAYSATATNDVSFNGRLLSVDLPMVVKFFPSKKQDFYISTGINSSTYLSQKYTYNYSWSNFGYRNGEAQTQQQTDESSLKGFDFANSAIIAIGINQNLGKNVLIFEPYYRPALSTMGDKNLRISSAGLNLKFNFNGNSKK